METMTNRELCKAMSFRFVGIDDEGMPIFNPTPAEESPDLTEPPRP